MPRYFIEVRYKGTSFRGFQSQDNAITIQGEIEKALKTYYREDIVTTTSSRTDAGVHALQNFLHADFSHPIQAHQIYHLNAILHPDIDIRKFYLVADSYHSRFDASSRQYAYKLSRDKNPFVRETRYFFPFPLNLDTLNECASILQETSDFTSFAKRHSDVKHFRCEIKQAYWSESDGKELTFHVEANRFLRGMVRALVATQLQVGRGKQSIADFTSIIAAKDCTRADFSAPAHGLFLEKVNYPHPILSNPL